MSRFYDWVTRGTRAAQAAAAVSNKGMLYWVSDEDKLERSSGSAWEAMGVHSGMGYDIVNTAETQAAGSGASGFLDLATVGPTVTLAVTGTIAVVEMSAIATKAGGGFTGFIALAISGASAINPSNPNPVFPSNGGDNGISVVGPGGALSGTYVITGLTPGINVFTMKYHNDGGATWTFSRRIMKVYAK
jgi:hypothetical protein